MKQAIGDKVFNNAISQTKLLVARNNSEVQDIIDNAKKQITAKDVVIKSLTYPKFKRWFIGRLKSRLKYYLKEEQDDQMISDDPFDVEYFFLYLLLHAHFTCQNYFPELFKLISRTKGIIMATFTVRQSNIKS